VRALGRNTVEEIHVREKKAGGGSAVVELRQRNGRHSTLWRTKNWDRLSLISSKNPQVSPIDRDDGMFWEHLAHSHEAQVGKIRLLVRISISQTFKLSKVFAALKRELN
jgi:hypothetical protein